MKSLGSDNHAGVHPQIMNAIVRVNKGHEAAYGADSLSKELDSTIKKIFGDEWNWFHCFNGTAANVLSLKTLVQSHNSILCSQISHLNLDECGSPEFQIGAKLILTKHNDGKICLLDAAKKIIRLGDQHYSQIKALSITQPTELGTCYSKKELENIKLFCKKNNLFLHIDGARFSNASFSLNIPFKKIMKDVDAVSFGGTKNGLLGSELVLIKKNLCQNFKFIRKQSMQLPSKTRFLAAQFIEFFKDNLYLKIAEKSCSMAKYLKEQIQLKTNLKPNYPVESNSVFINLKKNYIKELRKIMFFYVWDEHTFEVRLMTNFNTTKKEIDTFVKKLTDLTNKDSS